ncbi:unnamed protein product [Didymodactylos carnosus]|uniref:Uncharacterized protein n=1 Tax=Didymodactylos carnosus TaxID=1234261 RepID=A0A813ZBK3_9BILA|nr:unnamed protein product [Didymodactylos carnosus]CAF1298898.1 unnamed protein product [Didymodactylos carnosus]CAF3680182.1 unnamed protein product [Didymodactylos carnosus]CAF4104679.1 unnamed protein product [Didymodactylos carnosus]
MRLCTCQELRLYESFAEIRQLYENDQKYYFRQDQWNDIKEESIVLLPNSSMYERKIIRKETNMKGKTVFVRKYPEQHDAVECTMIHDDNYVVQEKSSGRYFHAKNDLVEYIDVPVEKLYELSFNKFDKSSTDNTKILTYLVNSLKWRTRYLMNILLNGTVEFSAFADIINSGRTSYTFNTTHLFSGDISVSFLRSSPHVDRRSSKTTSSTIGSGIEDQGEYNGIHMFSLINRDLIIESQSTTTFPYVKSPSINVKTILSFTLILSTTDTGFLQYEKRKFSRLYLLSNSSTYIPNGLMLIYDNSILSGEWSLPKLGEGERYEFELGEDADVLLMRNSTSVINKLTNTTMITTHVLIQNYKNRQINVRFKSVCQLECLFYNEKAVSLGHKLRYELLLRSKSEVAFSYSALRLNNKKPS